MMNDMDCSDAFILVSATITVPNTAASGAAASNRKNMIIENCAPFSSCISKINNTQINDAKDIDNGKEKFNRIYIVIIILKYPKKIYGITTKMNHF